jgi:DNA-binding MarR family transcriptional regulator
VSAPSPAAGQPGSPQPASSAPDFEMIELIFFAYRDFVGEADRALASYGFGRAHHRVLHFVNRHPGLTIAGLLDILGITKQSLARVLKDLMDKGCIVQEAGREDRRQRLLRLTDKGLALAADLAERQSARIGAALRRLPEEQRATVRSFLLGLLDPASEPAVRRLLAGSGGTPR